MRLDLLSN